MFNFNQKVFVTPFRHLNPNARNTLPGTVTKRHYNKRRELQYDVIVEHYSTGRPLAEPVTLVGITAGELDPMK